MNYMTEHLLEAIEVNKIRKPLYAKLSNNKSKKISNAMIAAEHLSLLSSIPLDRIANYWSKRNVPVMLHEFISMDKIPDFKAQFEDNLGISSSLPQFNTQLIEKELLSLFHKKEHKQISFYADEKIREMEDFSKHFCVVRHVLESIRRGANLIPMHIKRAQEMNVKSPESFCRYLLWNQLKIVHISRKIDQWAHPLQKDGLPILFQDIPLIPGEISDY